MKTLAYRHEIDGLRMIAVFGAVFFHLARVADMPPWFERLFTGGMMGVDVFFVISGYLIGGIVLREVYTGHFSFMHFYERRIRRIMPALLTVSLATVPFALVMMDAQELLDYGKSLLGISFFVSNYVFFQETSYFAGTAEYVPLLNTWSLGVEEQFYIAAPFIFAIGWRYLKHRVFWLIGGLFIVSFVLAEYLSYHAPEESFFMPYTRAWELMAGGALAYFEFRRHAQGKQRHMSPALSLLGVSLVLASYVVFTPTTPHPSRYTMLTIIGTGLVLWFGSTRGLAGWLLSNRTSKFLGLSSYSIYLWHAPLIAFIGLYGMVHNTYTPWVVLGVTLIFSALSWHYIEQPFRNRQVLSWSAVLKIILPAWVLLAVLGGVFYKAEGLPQRHNLSPELMASYELPRFFDDQGRLCMNALPRLDHFQMCTFNSQPRTPDFLFVGDSHAFALKDAIKTFAYENNLYGAGAAQSGCPPLLNVVIYRKGGFVESCKPFNDEVFQYVKNNNIKTVFFHARWTMYTEGKGFLAAYNQEGRFKVETPRLAFVQRQLTATLRAYKEAGVRVILVGAVPEQLANPRRVYARMNMPLLPRVEPEGVKGYLTYNSVPLHVHRKKQAPLHQFFQGLEQQGLVSYLDITKYLCEGPMCPIGTPEVSYYNNPDHLSVVGAKRLVPALKQAYNKP